MRKRVFGHMRTGLSAGSLANSAHPDQTPQNAASDQDVHCLLKLQEVRS